MPIAGHTVRWGDAQSFDFNVPAAIAFNQTARVQLVDARVDYPTTWCLVAQAQVVALVAGDEILPSVEVTLGIGAARVPFVFPLPTLTLPGEVGQLNSTLGTFLPVFLPAEALYIDLVARVTNPGAASAHRTSLRFAVGVAPVFREDRPAWAERDHP